MRSVFVGLRARSFRSAASGTSRGLVRLAAVTVLVLPVAGCTSQQRTGQSSSYLIMDSLTAASGATPDVFNSVLPSDVITNVKTKINGVDTFVTTVFEDVAKVTLSLGLKDPGSPDSPTKPTSNNTVTVTRYHVEFIRSDGRNAPGVDVPYPFDGAVTFTVGATAATSVLTLVRVQAKQEAPLLALANGGGAKVISVLAQLTLYGTDQTGRQVTVSGQIGVNFSDWGDPQ